MDNDMRVVIFVFMAALWTATLYAMGISGFGWGNLLFFVIALSAADAFFAVDPETDHLGGKYQKTLFILGGILLLIWLKIFGIFWDGRRGGFDHLLEISAWFVMGGFTVGGLMLNMIRAFSDEDVRGGKASAEKQSETKDNHQQYQGNWWEQAQANKQGQPKSESQQRQDDFTADFDEDYAYDGAQFHGNGQQKQEEQKPKPKRADYDASKFSNARDAAKWAKLNNVVSAPSSSQAEREMALRGMMHIEKKKGSA